MRKNKCFGSAARTDAARGAADSHYPGYRTIRQAEVRCREPNVVAGMDEQTDRHGPKEPGTGLWSAKIPRRRALSALQPSPDGSVYAEPMEWPFNDWSLPQAMKSSSIRGSEKQSESGFSNFSHMKSRRYW